MSKEICSISLNERKYLSDISLTHLLSLSRGLLYKYSNKLLWCTDHDDISVMLREMNYCQ